jgi:hypothetical protein
MTTHETFIHAVRDAAVARLNDDDRAKVLDVKLVYGAGYKTGARGVTFNKVWKNGHDHDLCEICAFGEDSIVQVAGTTIHELAHALAGCAAGHSKAWADACAKLGLRFVRAAGTRYSLACFTPDVRQALATMPLPTDGGPGALRGLSPNVAPVGKGRPCGAGIGTRGGKSRGVGSGSRLRKYVCDCGVIIRASRDDLAATCNLCGSSFNRA